MGGEGKKYRTMCLIRKRAVGGGATREGHVLKNRVVLSNDPPPADSQSLSSILLEAPTQCINEIMENPFSHIYIVNRNFAVPLETRRDLS